MDSRQPKGMWRNYVLFLMISFAILVANMYFNPPRPPKNQPAAGKPAEQQQADGKEAAPKEVAEKEEPGKKETAEAAKNEPEAKAEEPAKVETAKEEPVIAAAPEPAEQWLTIGSAEENSPYRMLATFTNRGAALARVELSSQRYRDLEFRGGYMGHLLMDPKQRGEGALVQVVGPGTPAAKADIKAGDLIKKINGFTVTGYESFNEAMRQTSPGQSVNVELVRDGKSMSVSVALTRRPMEVIRPENAATVPTPMKTLYSKQASPLSFLMTLKQVDKEKLPDFTEAGQPEEDKGDWPRPKLSEELKGVHLRDGTWEVVSHTESEVIFQRVVPRWGLEVRKIFRLVEVPKAKIEDPDYKAYHLVVNVEIRNRGKQAHKVAYQLDGPNGLPVEGYWYASKIGRSWGAVGLRDMVVSLNRGTPALIGAPAIAEGNVKPPYQGDPVTFIGVDAQYFSAVMIPQKKQPEEILFAESEPLRVGPVNADWLTLTNTTFRVTSETHELKPEESVDQGFLVFAGPKRPPLLAQYGLGDVVVYGWFWWVAEPMLTVLHTFYAVFRNYGIAIILLTVLVRGCMFPLSIKQAAGAVKMQQIQPELKKLQEKYKGDLEGRNRAQRELFRKHNYNPASGCLVMFLQLPIFIGLYRSLMVDVELRQAPLFSEAIRWCSNLAAPDMFLNWQSFMPAFITSGHGMFGLGPYLNLLPILTIVLFIGQQKMLMPPPADDQAAMQQRIMKYMMVFMGILFFKVASGLCLYFIASSLWSLAERQFLPKATPVVPDADKPAAEGAVARGKTLASKLLPGGSNGDTPAERRKKRPRPKR